MWRDYLNAYIMGWKTVGANCVEKYDEKTEAELREKTIKQEQERAIREQEYRVKAEREMNEFKKRVEGLVIELSDEDGWNKCKEANQDDYGKGCIDYAEGWALLMQAEIAKGKTIAECGDETQRYLDFMGITGFMYGMAISILAQTWKHGDELRKWHNKKYNVGENVKGTVNPAVLTIKG